MPTPNFDPTPTLPHKIRILPESESQEVTFEDLGDGGIMAIARPSLAPLELPSMEVQV